MLSREGSRVVTVSSNGHKPGRIEYYGPGGRGELRGHPRLVAPGERARDVEAQPRLWRESERLTGVSYPV